MSNIDPIYSPVDVARIFGVDKSWIARLFRRPDNPIPFRCNDQGQPLYIAKPDLIKWVAKEAERTSRHNYVRKTDYAAIHKELTK